jgi:hypothetical protein
MGDQGTNSNDALKQKEQPKPRLAAVVEASCGEKEKKTWKKE